MKATLGLSDAPPEAAKAFARERGTSRALVEEGLRTVLARKPSGRPFRLRDASFNGRRRA